MPQAKRNLAALLSVLLILVFIQAAPAQDTPTVSVVNVTARHGQSVRGVVDGVSVLVLRGDHHQRGVDHGVLAGSDILRLLNEGFLPVLETSQPGAWEERFLPAVGMFHFEDRYEQELGGLLEGIRKALPDAADRKLETLDREITLEDLKALQCIGDIMGMACSSFSAWGELTEDGQPITGHNLDYQAFPVGMSMLLMAVQPSEQDLQATLDLGAAGFVGAGTALNEAGVFAALHDSNWRTSSPGVVQPRPLAIRSGLEAAAAASAAKDIAASLQRLPPCMGANVHVSAPSVENASPEVAVLEWDGRPEGSGVTIRRPPDANPYLVCTNHYLSRAGGQSDNSTSRYDALSKGVRAAIEESRLVDLHHSKALMNSVGRDGGVVTYVSAIVWPHQRKIAFSFMPEQHVSATKGRWLEIEWDTIFAAK